MLIVVQFPMGDGRALTSKGAGRISRPEWGKDIETFGNTVFVRYFGHVKDRSQPADAAWVDERYFCQAKHALVLPDLQADRWTRCAFRRLFVAEGKVVVRVEVGFAPPRSEVTPAGLIATAGSIARLGARVPEDGGPGSTRPLISQGRRLARLYAYSTTRKDAPPEARRLIEAGRPMIVVEQLPSEAFAAPPGATIIDAKQVGGCDLAFLWLKTDDGAVPMWIMRRGSDPSRARSLRLCLLRVNAEQEALSVVTRLIDREVLQFEPETEPGQRLRDYLKDTTRRLDRETWSGISQTAVMDAIAAAEQVTYADDREGMRRSLAGIEHQIVAKAEAFQKERDAKRTVNTYTAEPGGTIVTQNVNITNSTLTNVAFTNAMRDAIVTLQAAPVSDERKKAVEDLVKVATDLVEQLPDDKAKADVTKRVEVITKQAADPDPLEDVVRAAGETIVKIGQGVADLAGPIATAVNTVLSVLKFAPLVL